MSDPILQSITMHPGGIVVVGPMGHMNVHIHASGRICFSAENCDYINPSDEMSDAHKAIVDERWATRTEEGKFIGHSAVLSIPDDLVKALTSDTKHEPTVHLRDREEKPAKPWWKFWSKRT